MGSASPSLPPSLESLSSILSPSELICPSSSSYVSESKTWSASKNLSPKLIARPTSLASLSALLTHLSTTHNPSSPLNIAIRSTGTGSSSASDLLISMTAFNTFTFHPPSPTQQTPPTMTIGTGQSWAAVVHALDDACPGTACISARCSFVGVGGGLTMGGQGWLSSEFGMASDPGNLLDAMIVLADGRIVHSAAAEEPELLWAIRGGGGSFGVVVEVTLRVFPDYAPKGIFTGKIFYPRSQLEVVVRAVAEYSERCLDPKMAMHFYCLTMETTPPEDVSKPKQASIGVAIMLYDARGEEHGMSEEGFKWAMDIEGATVMTQTLDFVAVSALSDELQQAMGVANSYFSGITVPKVDERIILNAWSWMDKLLERDAAFAEVPLGTVVLIELMQKPALQSLQSPSDAAWPHTRNRHVVQLGGAAPRNRPELEAVVVQALADAPQVIVGDAHDQADFLPNFLHEFNDPKKIFGGNYGKLVELKKEFDPKGLFGGRFMESSKHAGRA